MSRKKQLYAGAVLLAVTMLSTACGAMVHSNSSRTVQPDSGVQDQNYQGVAQPVLSKSLKLSEEEQKNGIQKLPILSRTGQPLKPEVQVTHTLPPERQVDASVKPHL